MKPGSSWDKNFQAFKKAGYLKRDGVRAQDQKFYLQVRRIFLEEKKKALSILRSQNVDLYNRVQLRQLKKREGGTNDRTAIDRLLALPK